MANTLLKLRESVSAYLQLAPSGSPSIDDLTYGSTNLFLVAVNNAVEMAQRNHDFNLLYDSIEVTVDPTTGAKWNTSLRKLSQTFELDSNSRLLPIRWDTQQNLSNQRIRDYQVECGNQYEGNTRYVGETPSLGEKLIEVVGDTMFYRPTPTAAVDMVITGWGPMAELALDTDEHFLLTYGFEWLMWTVIIELDHLTKQFLFRQEGNKGEPVQLAKRAWDSLIAWDSNLYDQQLYMID